jgi:hypothetical protein
MTEEAKPTDDQQDSQNKADHNASPSEEQEKHSPKTPAKNTGHAKNNLRVGRQRTLRDKWRLTSLSNKTIAVATAVIAMASLLQFGTALFQWLEMRSGGSIMQGQLDEMRNARRPWVGIAQGIEVRDAPRFYFSPINNQLSVRIAYIAHNFGTSPALRVMDTSTLVAKEDDERPALGMQQACQGAEFNYKNLTNELTTLFPGTDNHLHDLWYAASFKGNVEQVKSIWFCACFVYTDSSNQIRHTKYWFLSASNGKPLASFMLWSVEAD